MKRIIIFGVLLISTLVLSGCNNNKWSLFVYPNGNLSEESMKTMDAYSSFEECKKGFEFSKKAFPKATFECGRKCRIQDSNLDLYMCEETKD